jgi:hypothetical protein
MKAAIACGALGALLILSACGKPSSPSDAERAAATAAASAGTCSPYFDRACPESEARPEKAVTDTTLPKADPQTPDSRYVKITSGNQLMFLYYGLSGIPADYEAVANAYSDDYRHSSDAFRKQDIMNAIKPRIDDGIMQAKSQRYFTYEIGRPDLQHYDFASKSFAMNNMADGYTWYMNDNSGYRLAFTNADAFHKLAVSDEALARKIEGAVGKYPSPSLTVYGFAQEADLNEKLVKAQIVKVVLRDTQGNALASN